MKISKAWYWLLPVIWGAWIIYLSLLPAGAGLLVMFGIPHFDKIAHLGAYGVWSFLFLFAARQNWGSSVARNWWIVGILCLVGCGLEFGQYYLHEGRSFEIWDMVANATGSVLGLLLGRWLKWI